MIAIETNRLFLRNYRVTDFEDIIKYFSDEEVSKYEDFYPMSEEQVRNMITEWQDMDNRQVMHLFIIYLSQWVSVQFMEIVMYRMYHHGNF